jgi:hypothetical protein
MRLCDSGEKKCCCRGAFRCFMREILSICGAPSRENERESKAREVLMLSSFRFGSVLTGTLFGRSESKKRLLRKKPSFVIVVAFIQNCRAIVQFFDSPANFPNMKLLHAD